MYDFQSRPFSRKKLCTLIEMGTHVRRFDFRRRNRNAETTER